jgi:hypothetical protein
MGVPRSDRAATTIKMLAVAPPPTPDTPYKEDDVMSVLREHESTAEEATHYWTDWISVAECMYGFDRQTAQRLAFVRWLRLTGRLRDDEGSCWQQDPG